MKVRKMKNTTRRPAPVISTRMSGEMTGMTKQMDYMLRLNTEQKMKSTGRKRKGGRSRKRRRKP